ncbi:MAG: helix-turn-helix transcriptional regulator [Candidatus Magasanikbacteria bacterium]|nr:helix-turn-helix transcriptional regulator [Candidatus Magasanikbacteria bacterium]
MSSQARNLTRPIFGGWLFLKEVRLPRGNKEVNNFGDFLRRWRKERDLKQYELAKEVGVPQGTISAWEVGRQKPQGESLRNLSQVLGITLVKIMGLLNQPTTANRFLLIMPPQPVSKEDLAFVQTVMEGLGRSSIEPELLMHLITLRQNSAPAPSVAKPKTED